MAAGGSRSSGPGAPEQILATPAPPLWRQLYTFQFFAPATEQLILANMGSERRMRLALPPGCPFTDEEVAESLLKRIPCFIGARTCHAMFDPEVAFATFTEEEAMAAQKRNMRYAVAGLAKVENREQPAVVIHAWAPNLESRISPDYKPLVAGNGLLRADKYHQQVVNMMHCIFRAAAAYAPGDGRPINLYLPMVGQGFYVASLSLLGQQEALTSFISALNSVAPVYPLVNATLVGLNDTPKGYPKDAVVPYVRQDLFRVEDATVFAVVNAWDSHSLIGNGGSQDSSVDGWMVSGCGANKTFRNTSYLHNTCYNPDLLDPTNWIR